jgi:hypothetical protein
VNKALIELTLAVAAPALRVLLSANGFNAAKTMSLAVAAPALRVLLSGSTRPRR